MQIKLQNVTPDYIDASKRSASQVWGHDLVINKGEHLHIIAPSGSGKSSLMHFIYGLRNDFSGQIFYDDADIKTFSVERFSSCRQKKISIIFQDLRLFENHSVRENIEIKRILNPYHPAEKIAEMAARLGIEGKLEQLTKTCSYGEQQRVAIIRSLMQPFDFLLLDEPYSHLDETNRQKAMDLIYEECESRGAAMIFADLKPLQLLDGEKTIYL